MPGRPSFKRLIVSLDTDNKQKVKRIVSALVPEVTIFKIGLIPFSKFGPEIVTQLKRKKARVFLDLKYYDIPNTMQKAACIAASLGVWAFTVHIKSGKEALVSLKKELTSFCKSRNLRRPLIIGVSELTSFSCTQKQVLKLVGVAFSSGIDGVVCSALEASLVRRRYKKLKIITPGIRSRDCGSDDQRRITTALEAFKNGADYIVVGRPILKASNYLKAVELLFKP